MGTNLTRHSMVFDTVHQMSNKANIKFTHFKCNYLNLNCIYMHCLHLVSHKPYFQNRTYNGYNKNKIAMANFFHIADFENAFWSITPGVALKSELTRHAFIPWAAWYASAFHTWAAWYV